ncbi:MAG: right-handed parallel beta-helix repeat-containing protein [Verrucomicrobiales bacterium]|nr:right-handed parallel beta-helix repeat-containing protein [Verrucomicrobiales bacterium]
MNALPRMVLAAVATVTLGAAELHVAPSGPEAAGADGSSVRPFGSLQRAVEAARRVPRGELRRIVVHGGSYYDVSVALTAADSGLVLEANPGEQPVLHGGRRIRGWQPAGNGQFAAALPAIDASGGAGGRSGRASPSDGEVRLLLVNGASRPRARFPATGRLPHESRFDVPWMSSTGGGWQRHPTDEELSTLRYRRGELPPTFDHRLAEVTIYHMWDESVVGLASHEPADGVLRFSNPSGHPPGAFGVREFVVWNTPEGMTRPGQWYHDRVGRRLVYWPLPGEDPNRLEIIAPTQTTILRIEGTRSDPAKSITVRGLTLAATTVPLVAGGFAAARFDGAVSLRNVEGCQFGGLTVRGVAGHGINSLGGVRDVVIEDCEITDCGAGGIYVGGDRITIRNNHVHGVGRSFPSAIGIFRGGRDSLVAHNEVHECTYSAINYGGTGNVIVSNLLYRCMTELHDGAAIYMFAATNCVLRGNVARDVPDTGGYGSSAYYLDERSQHSVVEGNLSVGVARPLHMHMATNNIVRDNVFIVEGDARLTFPRCEQFTLERNLLHATGDIRIENVGAITTWKDNLFFSGTGGFTQVYQTNYQNRRTVEAAPPGTTTDDPLFVDRAGGDFRYRPDSPAARLGLKPVVAAGAGRSRGP